MVTRREVLRRGVGTAAALTAGPFLASCAPGAVSAPTATAGVPTATATLPPPETTSIAITVAPCDSAMFAADRFLREEGFSEVTIGDRAALGEMTAGKAQLGSAFPMTFFAAVENGPKVICLGGLHTGCAEVWAQPGISSVKDLKGRNITVTSKALGNIPYAYFVMLLQQAGLDPAKDVNFVVQSDADPLRLFLDGKNDAVFVATTGAVTIKTNPANKGKMINSQVMDQPWASTNCCFITASEQWYRANPIAAKRAMRAIYRTADALPADRGDAAKAATDKGLFGGATATANVREAANMVPLDWRTYDVDKAMRFYAPLLPGVLKASTDELLKAVDLKIFKELSSELKK